MTVPETLIHVNIVVDLSNLEARVGGAYALFCTVTVIGGCLRERAPLGSQELTAVFLISDGNSSRNL